MKKVISIIICCLLLLGCMKQDMKAKNAVDDYFAEYNNLTNEVIKDLEKQVKEENLTEEQEKIYRDILKKQYQDLKYEIENETYDGDQAIINVKITVYDLYKASKEATSYMQDHKEEFYDEDDIYSNKKYIDYKLEQMKKTNDRVSYTIDFNVNKKDNKWILKQPSEIDLEKIHGIYNYEL